MHEAAAIVGSTQFFDHSMDQIRVDKAPNELKSARERLANLERDQAALAEHLAASRRAQRRIGYYLVGLIILFSLAMVGAFRLTL